MRKSALPPPPLTLGVRQSKARLHEIAAMISRRLEQWNRPLLLSGAAIWLVSWLLNGQTAHGAVAVLGLSEHGWRRLLDPGTLLLMAGLLGFHRRRRDRYGRLGLAGFVTTECGLAAIFIGNFIEYWVGDWLYVDTPGLFKSTGDIGWAVCLVGVAIMVVGLFVVGVAMWRMQSGNRGRSPA